MDPGGHDDRLPVSQKDPLAWGGRRFFLQKCRRFANFAI